MVSADGGGITLGLLHEQTQEFAVYARMYPNPDDQAVILARGFVEECMEVCGVDKRLADPVAAYAETADQPPDPKELGDLLFYVSEISRIHNIGQTALMGDAPDLGAWQRMDDRGIVPIISPATGEQMSMDDDPRGVLAVTVMRAVDVMFPAEPRLWEGVSDKPDLARALGDVVRAAMRLASKYGIGIESAFEATVLKLRSRTRDPGVLGEAKKLNGSLRPEARRLAFAVPGLGAVATKAA